MVLPVISTYKVTCTFTLSREEKIRVSLIIAELTNPATSLSHCKACVLVVLFCIIYHSQVIRINISVLNVLTFNVNTVQPCPDISPEVFLSSVRYWAFTVSTCRINTGLVTKSTCTTCIKSHVRGSIISKTTNSLTYLSLSVKVSILNHHKDLSNWDSKDIVKSPAFTSGGIICLNSSVTVISKGSCVLSGKVLRFTRARLSSGNTTELVTRSSCKVCYLSIIQNVSLLRGIIQRSLKSWEVDKILFLSICRLKFINNDKSRLSYWRNIVTGFVKLVASSIGSFTHRERYNLNPEFRLFYHDLYQSTYREVFSYCWSSISISRSDLYIYSLYQLSGFCVLRISIRSQLITIIREHNSLSSSPRGKAIKKLSLRVTDCTS